MANQARRQGSTTSLGKFIRQSSPEPNLREADFCNAFWGPNDAGVDVLFARMRGATRTMEELRAFWKERAAIEEDYAKRMAKLSKAPLGRDEIGALRKCFDTLRAETEQESTYHLNLAQSIRTDIEGPTAAFCGRQAHHKKTFQSVIEKNWKAKQTQEAYVHKAREKYETDCQRINAYTAQSTLLQGKELEKVQLKLERAQQTVQANQRDFANFAKALSDTVKQWEVDWKAFCDSCQDLEDDRMDFLKDYLWAFANAVSTVCVSDDESCEHIRVSLETFEPERDQEAFVRDFATGTAIPDPPGFVDYNSPDAVPSASARTTFHSAHFLRQSQRQRPGGAPLVPPAPAPAPEEMVTNQAGVGSALNGGLERRTTMSSRSRDPYAGANSVASPSSVSSLQGSATGASSPAYNRTRADSDAEPIDPTSRTMLKIGNSAYDVNVGADPQQQSGTRSKSPMTNGAGRAGVGDERDPLRQQMAALRTGDNSNQGAARRNSVYNGQQGPQAQQIQNASRHQTGAGPGSISGLSVNGDANRRDYRNSAEFVVGSYPGGSPNAGASPSAPRASFMLPPSNNGDNFTEEVVREYGQSFPGERRLSRQNSHRSSYMGHSPNPSISAQSQLRSPSPQPGTQRQGRPVSREGHAGIGANGRSASPGLPVSRAASPSLPVQQTGQGSRRVVSPAGSYSAPPPTNSVGIALDPTGKVAVDSMADPYNRQQPPQRQQSQSQNWNQAPPPAQPSSISQRRGSFQAAPPPQGGQGQMVPYGAPPPAASPNYGAPPPPPQGAPPAPPQQYQQPQQVARQQQQSYQQQPPYAQPAYQPPPPPVQQPPPQQYAQPPPQQQQFRGTHTPQASGYSQYGYSQSIRAPSPQPMAVAPRSPSPQPPAMAAPPTGQYTEDGKPVLFYVKALYDYQATIDEEFDFQSGDIIAVTATPEDGWWSGELLDEARRVPRRHIFPSNFVTLF